jgi:hypothetical protein
MVRAAVNPGVVVAHFNERGEQGCHKTLNALSSRKYSLRNKNETYS